MAHHVRQKGLCLNHCRLLQVPHAIPGSSRAHRRRFAGYLDELSCPVTYGPKTRAQVMEWLLAHAVSYEASEGTCHFAVGPWQGLPSTPGALAAVLCLHQPSCVRSVRTVRATS